MKKFLLLISMIFITNVANAQTEYYTSVKLGAGDTTIYADDDTTLGDRLVEVIAADPGFADVSNYSNSGLLWDAAFAMGIDWSPSKMYVKHNPYGWFHLRFEGELGYNNYREDGKLKDGNIVQYKTNIKFDHFFLLANGYADFGIDDIVPYVGLGIGYSFGKEELTISEIHYNDSIDDNGVIYGLYAGVGYKYSDITTFDLGYRRIYAPAEDEGLTVFSSIRFGARFRI